MRLTRKHYLAIGAGLIALLAILPHTPPIENAVLAKLKKLAKEQGFELDAEKLDLYPFALKAVFKGLTLEGHGLDLQLDRVMADGDADLLRGKIALDAIELREGQVSFIPPPAEPQPEPVNNAPLEIPEITLGHAEVRGVSLSLAEKTVPLDFAVEDLLLLYAQQHLKTTLTSLPGTVATRSLPRLNISLEADSPHFTDADNIELHVRSEQSSVSLNGKAGFDMPADLKLELKLGEDLLPELPGVALQAALSDRTAFMRVNAQVPVMEESMPFELTTNFFYQDAAPTEIPLAFTLGDLTSGQIDLQWLQPDLKGTLKLDVNPIELARLVPLTEPMTALSYEAHFDFPELDSTRLTAEGTLVSAGVPALRLNTAYQDGAVTLVGGGEPLPGGRLQLDGSFVDGVAKANLEGELTGLDSLAALLPIPEGLCSGPTVFEGALHYQDDRLVIDDLQLGINQLLFAPAPPEDLFVQVQGPLDALVGEAHGARLNPREEFARFRLNAPDQIFDELSLAIDGRNLKLSDEFIGNLLLDAEGRGSLEDMKLNGFVEAFLNDDKGWLSTPFHMARNTVRLSDLKARSFHGRAFGEMSATLDEALAYQLDLHLDVREDPTMTPLANLDLPEARIALVGNHELIKGSLKVAEGQAMRFDKLNLLLESPLDMNLDILPPRPGMSGGTPEWHVAGLALSDFGFYVDESRISAHSHFRLNDAEVLQAGLGELWPEGLALETLRGVFTLESDTSLVQPIAGLAIHEVRGSFNDGAFAADDVKMTYGTSLKVEPFAARFAGIGAHISHAEPSRENWPQGEEWAAQWDPIGLEINFGLDDFGALSTFLELPPELVLSQLDGSLRVFTDLEMTRPRAIFSNLAFKGDFQEHHIEAADLGGYYLEGFHLRPGEIKLDDFAFTTTSATDGFKAHASLTTEDLDALVGGFVGSAQLNTDIYWHNLDDGNFSVDISVKQSGGPLVYIDPWLVFKELQLNMSYHPENGLVLESGGANLNGGTLEFSGSMVPNEDDYDFTFKALANEVMIDMVDAQLGITSAVEWKKNKTENMMRASVFANNGYLTPELEIKGLVDELLNAVPELSFPDPMLEEIQLETFFTTLEPLIVETDIAYMEIEVPWLVIGGNLAEPTPLEGFVNINRGSSLDLGNRTFVFKESQIQFLKNRPDDPYLLVSLEAVDDANDTSLNLTGFLSELSNNMDANNLTSILANYLVGQVSSLVSLESERNDTLFDDSFTFVISKPLTRKVITRYAIPVNEGKKGQRIELSVGPYFYNYLNLTQREDNLRGDLKYSRKLGYPDGERPPKIRKVVFPKETPRWVKRKFKLKRDMIYTDTQWRRARLDLTRRLRELGYLQPEINHTWENRILRVDFAFGPQTLMEVQGLELTKDERKRLFRRLRTLDDSGMRHLESQVERLAIGKGYPSAAAHARLEGDTLFLRVFLSQPLGKITLDFGKAQTLLSPLYKDAKPRQEFMTEYMISPDAARDRLRARLAAKGYLLPDLGEGEFTDMGHFSLPIDPGEPALLAEVSEGGKPIKMSYVGKRFTYEMIEKVASELQLEAGRDTLVRLKPRRQGKDVIFEVQRQALEETLIETLDISGNHRIDDKTIKRFLGFEEGMSQQDLIEAQERLIASGTYTSSRLRADKNATLNLVERNRWDADYLVSWDEDEEWGHALQVLDHHLFGGFNELGMRVDQTKYSRGLVGRLHFRRVRGTPLDIKLTLNWHYEQDRDPVVIEDLTETQTTWVDPEDRDLKLEFLYPLGKRQNIGLGITREQRIAHTERLTEGEIFNFETFEFEPFTETIMSRASTVLVPISLSWVYRHLDYPSNPRNGVLATASVDHYLDGGGNFPGNRYKASISTFKTWPRKRSRVLDSIMWTNRIETGLYDEGVEAETDLTDLESTSRFLLGGSTSVRGYRHDIFGPMELNVLTNNDGELVPLVRPIGGEGMYFFSQELTFTTRFLGMGLTPFVDGGWLWPEYNDFLSSGLAISGGLGLSFDTPVGYFRLDWAQPIRDKELDKALEPYDGVERDLLEDKIFTEFYFRFGRVF